MNISKISRGIVVALFSALIILMTVVNLQITFSDLTFNYNILIKIAYVVSLILIVLGYAFIKEKLSKKNMKKKVKLFYRYMYLLNISFVVKMFYEFFTVKDISTLNIIMFSIISVITAVVLKKIIYNISKSDLLSVIGMVMFILLPNITNDKIMHLTSNMLLLSLLLCIMYMQKLIDELKQLGIKTKKFVLLSIVTGIFVGFSMVLNFSSIIWVILLVTLVLVTSNLDKTHLNFSNKFINALRQKNKELLYRVERIYINKIFISIFIIVVSSYASYKLLDFTFNNVLNIPSVKDVISFNVPFENSNVIEGFKMFKTIDKTEIMDNFKSILSNSKGYYLLLSIYILLIELLTLVLRRRYDTKSSIIKVLFILIIVFCSLFKLDSLIYSLIITTLLILISIINTSNLYLNRDERIKLLNS